MKILVLSGHSSSLLWFRLDMMKEFIKNGHDVIAVGNESPQMWESVFSEFNIKYVQIPMKRNGLNPVTDSITLMKYVTLFRNENPDKIFAYQAKPVVYGGIANLVTNIGDFYPLIAGLGSVFYSSKLSTNLIKLILIYQMKLACSKAKKVFFQNIDDKNVFLDYGIIEDSKAVIINGSGVNLETFIQKPLPNETVFLFIGRLIRDKGIIEYLEACRGIKEKYPNTRCMLIGPYDTNPSAINENDLKYYIQKDIIEYYGEQKDVKPYIQQATTLVLPSYHEGTPKSILEAMAMGRSIITTFAPGCKETVKDGLNGFLVPVKDVSELMAKMLYLIENPNLNTNMALESVKIVKEKYDVSLVNKEIMKTMNIPTNFAD